MLTIDNPKISIITIVFNDKAGIDKTIKSVLEQDFQSYEYVIIDGMSTDGSSDVIQSFASNVHVYIREKDEGIFDAFNKGIKHARGEWLYFLNAGDYFENSTIVSEICNSFLTNTSDEIVTGRVKILNQNDSFLGYYHPNSDVKITDLKNKNIIAHQATFIKKSVFNKIGLFRKYKTQMDYDLWIRAWTAGIKFKFIDKVIANFKQGGISSSRDNYLKALKEQVIILRENDLISPGRYQFRLAYATFTFKIKSAIRVVVGKKVSRYISLLNSRLS